MPDYNSPEARSLGTAKSRANAKARYTLVENHPEEYAELQARYMKEEGYEVRTETKTRWVAV
jgi:hypothetical protein